MTTSHHIGDAFLLDFAFGNLSEGWSLAVASHLALCPSCRNRLAAMEEVGGAFLEHFEQRPVSEPGSWELMRHRLEREDRAFGSVATTEGSKIGPRVLPEPLRSYLGGDLDDLKWRALGRGAYQNSYSDRRPLDAGEAPEDPTRQAGPGTHAPGQGTHPGADRRLQRRPPDFPSRRCRGGRRHARAPADRPR